MSDRIAGLSRAAASQEGRRVAIRGAWTDSGRLAITEDPPRVYMSGLTTHVLDTASGKPAAGVAVRLLRDGAVLVGTTTNADGRCDSPLLTGEAMAAGPYRLEFDVGAYYRAR